MSALFDTYRACHQQGFVPIFVADEFDTGVLLEGCRLAGVRVIEYTLRRPDSARMIPWLREHAPDLKLLAGSTIDDDRVVAWARERCPQMLSLAELDDIGVDGFVSMMCFSPETLARYCRRRLIIGGAATFNEALAQVRAGAHFAKLLGPDLEAARLCRAAPTFDYCPLFITGGMTLERIPDAVDAGAVVIGAGFDVILRGQPAIVAPEQVADAIRRFLKVTAEARARKWPQMSAAIGGDPGAWLRSLPHFTPFSEEDVADEP